MVTFLLCYNFKDLFLPITFNLQPKVNLQIIFWLTVSHFVQKTYPYVSLQSVYQPLWKPQSCCQTRSSNLGNSSLGFTVKWSVSHNSTEVSLFLLDINTALCLRSSQRTFRLTAEKPAQHKKKSYSAGEGENPQSKTWISEIKVWNHKKKEIRNLDKIPEHKFHANFITNLREKKLTK